LKNKKKCVVFVARGDKYLDEVASCIESSVPLAGIDKVLITD
jgi:hypothetical protein